jgi:uncharacterized protein
MSGVINIRRLEPGTSRHVFRLTASELQLESSDIVDFISCSVNLDVDCHPGEIIARGESETTLKLACARCLEPFEHKMVHNHAFVVKLVAKAEVGGDSGESTDDYYVLPDGAEEFDITSMIRERIMLSLPLKPLCDSDCKGLCPKCGVNRNLETCNCADDHTDGRWSALMKLKQHYGGN